MIMIIRILRMNFNECTQMSEVTERKTNSTRTMHCVKRNDRELLATYY